MDTARNTAAKQSSGRTTASKKNSDLPLANSGGRRPITEGGMKSDNLEVKLRLDFSFIYLISLKYLLLFYYAMIRTLLSSKRFD